MRKSGLSRATELWNVLYTLHGSMGITILEEHGLWDSSGLPVYHARDAFLPVSNRLSAELLCILRTIRSLRDLRVRRVELWSDYGAAIDAISCPEKWQLYGLAVHQILQSLDGFNGFSFRTSSPKANSIARDIGRIVTNEGRFSSYLALGGPVWLHNRIEEESWV